MTYYIRCAGELAAAADPYGKLAGIANIIQHPSALKDIKSSTADNAIVSSTHPATGRATPRPMLSSRNSEFRVMDGGLWGIQKKKCKTHLRGT